MIILILTVCVVVGWLLSRPVIRTLNKLGLN